MPAQQNYKFRCANCLSRNRIPAAKLNAPAKCGKCGRPLILEGFITSTAVMINDTNFDAAILKSPLPALLYCWAAWCPSCRAANPIIEEFARETKGRVRTGKLDLESSPLLAAKYNILSVPHLFIFDGGVLKERFQGGMDKYELMMKMAPYI